LPPLSDADRLGLLCVETFPDILSYLPYKIYWIELNHRLGERERRQPSQGARYIKVCYTD
jgi:hypothetical protein